MLEVTVSNNVATILVTLLLNALTRYLITKFEINGDKQILVRKLVYPC